MKTTSRGSALLSVMWLSAALAAIAFSLSLTVRGETERVSTSVDGLRAYYLARGSVQRAAHEVLWTINDPAAPPVAQNSTQIVYHYASGDVTVEFIPETAKLDLNTATVDSLGRLLQTIGVDSARSGEIASAIVDWRSPATNGGLFDQYYLSQNPSFPAPHASFQETEELLQVKGVTPEIYYGTWVPGKSDSLGGQNTLSRRPGLADCVTVYGSKGNMLDINTASPAVLASAGVPADSVAAIVALRSAKPFDQKSLNEFIGTHGTGGALLRVSGNSIVTIRATARLKYVGGQLSDLRRTVAAQFKYLSKKDGGGFHILRWYDTAWSN